MPDAPAPAPSDRAAKLRDFVAWAGANVTGDEKGEAQVFLDRLLQAFGQKGTLDVGGTPEMRVRKSAEDGGGTSFADYVWKPVVLVEMKKRGVDLRKHFRQAFDYWVRLVPGRPRYVVLCNFDAFHVYDFERQIDDPVDVLPLAELPDRWGPLAFLFPTNETPVFDNDREAVTRQAADALAACFNKLIGRKVDRDLARRFVLQSLVALFAEDIGLLPSYFFTRLIDEARAPPDAADKRTASYDLIGGLFEAMNANPPATGGRFKGVRYFNGGLFADPARLELEPYELQDLHRAATQDWSKVSPEIFGTLFEHSVGRGERAAYGQHFTLPVDIMKIVKPTIADPFSAAIESTKSGRKLLDLLERLTTLRVLDPACGSGNFLYVAYREMRRLEGRIRERLAEEFPREQPPLIHVSARQFFGRDVSRFAVELAKVTMVVARKLAIDELAIADENALPLDNLDANFTAGDALIASESAGLDGDRAGWRTPTLLEGKATITPWPPADVIVGNPPFNGAKKLKPDLGDAYVDALRRAYPDVPGMADYCVYWFRRAHDHLPPLTKADPFAGRAGLVGTQNVRNNKSREGGLDHVAATGTVVEAVDNQPWSGEANVHVSIANWVKTQDAALLPKTRRLWKVQPPAPGPRLRAARGEGPRSKQYELEKSEVDSISASLSDQTDVSGAKPLASVTTPQRCFNGNYMRHNGFRVSAAEARQMIEEDPKNADVLHPLMIGQAMLTKSKPAEWVIDFQQRDIFEARAYAKPFARIEATVLPHIAKLAADEQSQEKKTDQDRRWLETWWQHFRSRREMWTVLDRLDRYIACSRVTKRPVFCFLSTTIIPDNALQVFAFDDDYSFGVIQSAAHFRWFLTKSSKLKSDYRYTPNSVWDTFPWPQSPSGSAVSAVAEAGRRVRAERGRALSGIKGGLRSVYRTLELPGRSALKDAHAALDTAVLAAYGFAPKVDVLVDLLSLNQQVASAERRGDPTTPPGIPPTFTSDRTELITNDCVRAN